MVTGRPAGDYGKVDVMLKEIVEAEHAVSGLWCQVDPADVSRGLLDAIHAAETALACLRVAWRAEGLK